MEVFVRITKWIMVAAATLTAVSSHAVGNVEAGAAQAVTCAACHGQDGATAIDPSSAITPLEVNSQCQGLKEKWLSHQTSSALSNPQSDSKDLIFFLTASAIQKADSNFAVMSARALCLQAT